MLLVLTLNLPPVAAQDRPSEITPQTSSGAISALRGQPPAFSSIGFRQDLNAYLWNTEFQYKRGLGEKFEFAIEERFQSSLLRIQELGEKWKDDQNLLLRFHYRVAPGLLLRLITSSLVFSDRQSGISTDLQTHGGTFGFSLRSGPLAIAPAVGAKSDTRFRLQDSGLSYDVNARVDDAVTSGYAHSLAFRVGADYFGLRSNRDLHLGYNVRKEFYTDTSDSLALLWDKSRRDYYVSERGDVESLEENLLRLDNVLRYRMSGQWHVSITTTVWEKGVDVRQLPAPSPQSKRRRTDRRSENQARLVWQGQRLQGVLGVSYASGEQRYEIPVAVRPSPFSPTAFVAPDNRSGQFALFAQMAARLTAGDSIRFYTSATRYRYDTPDPLNFDDRDELRWNSSATVVHAFGPPLRMAATASANLHHFVYIYGERSGDNNWNRIFRLSPEVWYRPIPALQLHQALEVLANYVDYDFETRGGEVRSFVFRRFSWQDSLRYRWTARTSFHLGYRLEMDESGKLIWEQWLERPVLSRRAHWARAAVEHYLTPAVWLSSGVVFFERTEWRHTLDRHGELAKTKAGCFQSLGPAVKIRIRPSSKLEANFFGVRQRVKDLRGQRFYINNVNVLLNWLF